MNTFFKDVMSKRTDEELIKIVTVDRDGYQPPAVAAAEEEINRRSLPDAKIERITEELKAKTGEKNRLSGKAARWLAALADVFNPVQKETPATERIITLIAIFLGATFLYELYTESGMYRFAFFTDDDDRYLGMMFLIPFIYLPAAGLLFWFRKKIGWMLAASYFSYVAAGAIPMFVIALVYEPSGFLPLDALYTATSPAVWVGKLLFYGGLTYCLCRKNIRTVYRIDRKAMLIAFGLGTGVVLLITAVMKV